MADVHASSALLRALPAQRTVSREDCARVTALLVGKAAHGDTPRAAWRTLRQLDVVDDERVEDPKDVATRGYACLLFARALDEDQSLLRKVFPWSERYAYKQLLALHMIPEGGAGTPITGPELVGLLALAKQRVALWKKGGRS